MALSKAVKRQELRVEFDASGNVVDAWARRLVGVMEDGVEIAEAQEHMPVSTSLIQQALGTDLRVYRRT